MRHLAANGMTLLIVILGAAAAALLWGQREFEAAGPLQAPRVVEIPAGANLEIAAARLHEAGAIGSELVFRMGARLRGDDARLKRGCFDIPAGASMGAVLDRVTSAGESQACFMATFVANSQGVDVRVEDAAAAGGARLERLDLRAGVEAVEERQRQSGAVALRISVAEGLTVRQVVSALQAVPFLTGDIAETPAEGRLAPDTYGFEAGAARQALLADMAQLQTARLAQAWAARQPDLPLETPEELLTLASIVERETAVAEEREEVAAVFVNRLRQGMRLQTDPTIIYGITRGGGGFDRPIRRSDIDGVTERRAHGEVLYNTYVVAGLPPGPIANPGRAALMAAANPADSAFLYFVADGTGGHAFAETLAEHNENVARYRALQDGQ